MPPPSQCLGSTDHTGSDVVVVVAADRAAPAGFHRLSAFVEDRLHHVDAQRGTAAGTQREPVPLSRRRHRAIQ